MHGPGISNMFLQALSVRLELVLCLAPDDISRLQEKRPASLWGPRRPTVLLQAVDIKQNGAISAKIVIYEEAKLRSSDR